MTVENANSNVIPVKGWLLPGVVWVAIFSAILLFYREVGEALVRTWSTSPSFEHGYAVVVVTLGLLWLQRGRSFKIAPSPAAWGFGILIMAAFAMAVGDAASLMLLQQLALIAMIQASVLFVFGWPLVRENLFPLFYLYFAVPVGDFIVPVLRDVTAVLTVEMLSLAGLSATLDGYLIRLPTADYRVAEACAGLRFFIVGLAVSLLAAYLMLRSWRRRLIFLALALLIPVLGNALRAASVIYLEQKGLFDATTLFGHLTYGLGFTSVLIAALLAFAYVMRDTDGLLPAGIQSGDSIPVSRRVQQQSRMVFVAVLGLLVVATPFFRTEFFKQETRRIGDLVEPEISRTWRVVDSVGDGWRPLAHGADAEVWRSYTDGERALNIFIAYFATQRQGAEIVSDAHELIERKGWVETGRRLVEVKTDAIDLQIETVKIQSGRRQRLVMPLFWVSNKLVADRLSAKVLQAGEALFGQSTMTAVIVLSANYDQDETEAVSVLRTYLSSSLLVATLHAQKTR